MNSREFINNLLIREQKSLRRGDKVRLRPDNREHLGLKHRKVYTVKRIIHTEYMGSPNLPETMVLLEELGYPPHSINNFLKVTNLSQ